ncbi:hypothetical protein B0H10DRAFT_2393509 [Mycena sp. CBHHK59/15]|nr:hypothetical protein B0H10DRAFT_2393509 [Mycena sp. CBHHK59/15]
MHVIRTRDYLLILLESIGVTSKSDKKKAEGRTSTYQETVAAPLAREKDDDGEFDDEEDEEGEDGSSKLKAVTKLRQIIRSIPVSPQRRQAWLQEVRLSADFTSGKLGRVPLILILGVRTRWSSTHQMLRRALDHRKMIDDFVGKHRDLHHLDLTAANWDAISLVAGWLKSCVYKLGLWYRNHLMRVFRSNGGPIPTASASEHPSRPSLDAVRKDIVEKIKKSDKTKKNVKQPVFCCLPRGQFGSTKIIDLAQF